MRASSEKQKLDRQTLEQHGIYYFDNKVTSGVLPHDASGTLLRLQLHTLGRALKFGTAFPVVSLWCISKQVDWLRELLLDCRRLVPSYAAREYLREDEREEIPAEALFEEEVYFDFSELEKRYEQERFRNLFVECRQIARRACQNRVEGGSEHDWQCFMEQNIFKRYREGRRSPLDFTTNDDPLEAYAT
ncbi:hypothetical protein LTR37_009138 [Vermiconidia calcicola]|uniref:Uncharacterized protein n=1 Tax=Vermiconidia calcicola TaxID=1690605 RepID=A0ACC3NBI7_9PEZI|nr:hypothetical protein LTR37_009138 [Vermiconidia calcicola]